MTDTSQTQNCHLRPRQGCPFYTHPILGPLSRHNSSTFFLPTPNSLAHDVQFSQSSGFLYFTAGDHARVKTYVLPIPPTPSESTTHPKLSKKYTQPVALTHDRAATGLQPLLYGRALISKSSLVSPNEVFLVTGLEGIEEAISKADDDADLNLNTESLIKVERLLSVSEASLKGKKLSEGEEFWFKGGDGNKVQGWALKPAGWEQGKQKKYPAVLLIHGGPQGAWEDQWSTRWNPNGLSLLSSRPSSHPLFLQPSPPKATLSSPSTPPGAQPLGKPSPMPYQAIGEGGCLLT